MKRESIALIFACFALALMAQDGIRVHFKGAQPTICDFVSAFVSSHDDAEEDDCADEAFNGVAYAWERYQKGIPLEEGQTLTVDEKNGYVVYETRSEYESTENVVRMEMCYWNETDGKHKLFAYSVWCFTNGKPSLGQFDGITFYRYDNATKKMSYCDPPGFDVKYFDTSYALPRTGKDIIVTTWDENGNKEEKALKWNGKKFTF
ncbi:MAG: hypothetical protein IKW97_06230 [Muribaculaceae bacterium]|nr:hypothetical protein [Muribaculaceae bacterium]